MISENNELHNAIRKLADAISEQTFTQLIDSQKLPREISEKRQVDSAYIQNWGFYFSDDAIRNIETLVENKKSDQQIKEIVDEMRSDPFKLIEYIESCSSDFYRRFRDEYRYIIDSGPKSFPYKYLCDYAGKALPRSQPVPKSLHIEFIYCIKNRQDRTHLSVTSLENSYRSYINKNSRSLISISIAIVEDISEGMLDISALLTLDLPIRHYLVETGLSWSRSKLLNCGIKNSSADLLAFTDADFLFSEDFFFGLETLIRNTEVERHVYAINLIESETHTKGPHLYSRCSPYSYLWMVNRRSAVEVGGFDESYTGHGFEDRDFEHKLQAVTGLIVTDTVSVDPRAVSIHLSHSSRDGHEMQATNRLRFQERANLPPSQLLQQDWGNVAVLQIKQNNGYKNLSLSLEIDFLLIAHNNYHALSFHRIRDELAARGKTSALLDIRGDYLDEGAYIHTEAMAYVSIDDIISGRVRFSALACMNDWEKKIAAPLVDYLNSKNIPTFGIVEGVNDFDDVDTGRNRHAYKRVKNVLLNGAFDKRYFRDPSQNLFVVGVERLDSLLKKPKRSANIPRRINKAVVNINFTYGVLEEFRARWLAEIAEAASITGFEIIISKHHADPSVNEGFVTSTTPLYDLLSGDCVFISRFSGAILEALALGCPVIYHNPGFEKVDKFSDPLGAYLRTSSISEIVAALEFFSSGGELHSDSFLKEHADIIDTQVFGFEINGSLSKCADALVTGIMGSNPKLDRDRIAPIENHVFPWKAQKAPKPAPLTIGGNTSRKFKTLFLVISCTPYAERRAILQEYYARNVQADEGFVFVVGGAEEDYFDRCTNILHLRTGDLYEDLPEKVMRAIMYANTYLDFDSLIKVDDDVVFNFPLFRSIADQAGADYFGKMVPSKRGAKPSSTWHFGKVSERSPFYQKEFVFEGGVKNWACGGMYMLRRAAVASFAKVAMTVDPREFLYEDHMVGEILRRALVDPVFIQDTDFSDHAWIATDLREIMNLDGFENFEKDRLSKSVSIHCGPYPPFYSMTHEDCIHVMRKMMDFYSECAAESNQNGES